MDQQRDDLARLVRHHRTRLRLSYQDLSDRLADHGDPHVSRSWLHRLEHGQLPNPPKRPRLEAIAAALGLDTEELVEAFIAEFYGYLTVWSSDGTARTLVRARDWERWGDEDRGKVMRILDRKPDTDSM
jgi:transcriptional regulator with XRE-family HTH domain